MGEKLPKALKIYFWFLTIVLLIITILSIHILINTSSRIDEIREKILATPNKQETQDKIDSLKETFNSLLDETQQIINDLYSVIKVKNQQFLNELTLHDNIYDQVILNETNMKTTIEELESKYDKRLRQTLNNCDKSLGNVTDFVSTVVMTEEDLEKYEKINEVPGYHLRVAKILRPNGSLILTDPAFKVDSTILRLHLYPNKNQYLAIDDKKLPKIFEGVPSFYDYQKVKPVPNFDQKIGVRISKNESELKNVLLKTETQFNIPFQLNYDVNPHSLVPWLFQTPDD